MSTTHRFKTLSFKYKLIFSFIVVSIIPILILQSFSYYNTSVSMKKKVDSLVNFTLAQTSKNLDTAISSYTDMLYQIYMDDEIIELVDKVNEGSEAERMLAYSNLKDRLRGFINTKEGIRSIAILCSSGKIVCYDRVKEASNSNDNVWAKYRDVTQSTEYKDAFNSNNATLISTSYSDQWLGTNYYLFHIAKKMYNFNDMTKGGIGVAVISISEEILYKSCNQLSESYSGDLIKNINFIVDKNRNIVSFPDKKVIGTSLSIYKTYGKDKQYNNYSGLLMDTGIFDRAGIIINEYNDEKLGWTIINAMDSESLFGDIYWMQRATVIFGIAAILIALLVILYISRNFSNSMRKILNAMKTAQEGELSVQVDYDNTDELSTIAARFNKMMSKISQLVEEVKYATERKREAEITALEAQINPHFLYNTLDSINWMAIEKEEYEISKMLKNLAQILRYSINRSNKVSTIAGEIEWLEQYIYLQQNRFNYSFECQLKVEPGSLEYKIYKLLLQPVVENSIIHGFEEITEGGVIKIEFCSFNDDFIKITVEDNGKGIEDETLTKLRQHDGETIRVGEKGMGIENVFNRIGIYYGGMGRWSIESSVGKGTLITFIIPKVK